MVNGIVVKIQRFSIQDGPGIRTTVFLKGCPLTCLWCSNPETQDTSSELGCYSFRCINECNKCIHACEYGAIRKNKEGKIVIDRSKCVRCWKCVEVCHSGTLTIIGKQMSEEEVVEKVMKDYPFYIASGGGVTLSGGEPLYQYKFAKEIFKICGEKNVHRTLDTSGMAPWGVFKEVLEHTDLVLYDIKCVDPIQHEKLTGTNNKLILENAKRVSKEGVPIIIRVPVIPGINDHKENLRALAEFVKTLDSMLKVDLLPYHRLGVSKYEMLGRDYLLKSLELPSPEYMERVREFLNSLGVKAVLER